MRMETKVSFLSIQQLEENFVDQPFIHLQRSLVNLETRATIMSWGAV